MEYIRVKGHHFSFCGDIIRLRGFGIGNWLNLEHFMIGIPGSQQVIKEGFEQEYGEDTVSKFFEIYREEFFKEEDFKLLKECGVNFIRIPFNYRLFIEDNRSDNYREEGFLCFDKLLALCRKYEIFALLDLHTTPGGQNPDWHSDNSLGVPLFWEYQLFRRQMTKLWKDIAIRYKEEPYLMGYDLLNEPAMAKWPMLNEFYDETIRGIREVDHNHVIVLEGDRFSMNFNGLGNFEDHNLALSFHYYPTVWHPNLLNKSMDRGVRREKIADGLDKLLGLQEEFNIPVFCGEFGYGADCGNSEFTLELLKDTIGLMEERKVDWLLWSYKDAHFMSMVWPQKTTGWMKLVGDISSQWTQDIEKGQAGAILDYVGKKYFLKLTNEERYNLQFRLRANLYMLQKEHIIRPTLRQIEKDKFLELPYDFSFENCEIYEELKNYLEGILMNRL